MFGIFNDNFPPVIDGVAMTAQNYARWLHKKGKKVCVITPYAPNAQHVIEKEPYSIYRYPSVPIPLRQPYRFGLPWLSVPLAYKLNNMPFHLLHAHCPFTSGKLALYIARKKHIPLVATFHSKYRQDFERAIFSHHLVDAVIRDIVSFYQQAYEVWIPQIAVEPVLREYGYKGKIEVVENGSDMALPIEEIALRKKSLRNTYGVEKHEMVFLFVGQHIWEKNIGFMLDALALIRNRPFRLYMIGTGYAEEKIKEKISLLGLYNKVIMLGPVLEREKLQDYYILADLFLFPSLYDNAPLVVREAAAMNTPSVLIKDSTAAEIIQDGYNGILSENDVHAYADTLNFWMNNKNKLEQMGKHAAHSIVRSWEDVVDEVIERYEDVIRRYNK